jgi:pimeloyl-ACP methyl ester carboxylesterase
MRLPLCGSRTRSSAAAQGARRRPGLRTPASAFRHGSAPSSHGSPRARSRSSHHPWDPLRGGSGPQEDSHPQDEHEQSTRRTVPWSHRRTGGRSRKSPVVPPVETLNEGADPNLLSRISVPGFISHLEPTGRNHATRASSNGSGLSRDSSGSTSAAPVCRPTVGARGVETRMDDVRAVMDAVGSERASLFAFWEGGPMAAVFAATYPDRTSAPALFGTFARRVRSHDYPWRPTRDELVAAAQHRAESRCTSEHAWPAAPLRARCSLPRRHVSSPGPGSSSRIAASTSSKGFRRRGASSRSYGEAVGTHSGSGLLGFRRERVPAQVVQAPG